MIELLRTIPSAYVLSVTPDRGKAFSFHEQVTDAMNGMPFYFPKPHAPWERGTNENTNDILRYYFPKGYNFHELSDDDLQQVVREINNKPRKCLGWKTPAEVICECLGVALA